MCIYANPSSAFLQTDGVPRMCKHARMGNAEELQRLIAEQRAWLDQQCRETGLDLSNLARRSGMRESTLTRFRNSPNVAHALSARTQKKITEARRTMGTELRDRIANVARLMQLMTDDQATAIEQLAQSMIAPNGTATTAGRGRKKGLR